MKYKFVTGKVCQNKSTLHAILNIDMYVFLYIIICVIVFGPLTFKFYNF